MVKTISSGIVLTNAWLESPGPLRLNACWAELAQLRGTAQCGPARYMIERNSAAHAASRGQAPASPTSPVSAPDPLRGKKRARPPIGAE